MKQFYKPNPDDLAENFWNHNYLVTVTAHGIKFKVNADSEQDALDYVIDYCEDKMPGLVASYQELRDDDYSDDEIDDYYCGGNHSLYLTTHNIHIDVLR